MLLEMFVLCVFLQLITKKTLKTKSLMEFGFKGLSLTHPLTHSLVGVSLSVQQVSHITYSLARCLVLLILLGKYPSTLVLTQYDACFGHQLLAAPCELLPKAMSYVTYDGNHHCL